MNYIDAIQRGFPNVMCHSVGIDDSYESIVWDSGSPLPTKVTLDEWIAANPVLSKINRRITVLAFRNRFSMNEKVAIELASADNPSADMQTRVLSATLRSFLSDAYKATYIDLDRPDTRGGIMSLEQFGILTSGRALIILDAPVTELERSPI